MGQQHSISQNQEVIISLPCRIFSRQGVFVLGTAVVILAGIKGVYHHTHPCWPFQLEAFPEKLKKEADPKYICLSTVISSCFVTLYQNSSLRISPPYMLFRKQSLGNAVLELELFYCRDVWSDGTYVLRNQKQCLARGREYIKYQQCVLLIDLLKNESSFMKQMHVWNIRSYLLFYKFLFSLYSSFTCIFFIQNVRQNIIEKI